MSSSPHLFDPEILRQRQVSGKNDFENLVVSPGTGRNAYRYGKMVHDHSQLPGAHRTPAAVAGNDVLSHVKGKYGEFLFERWLSDHGLAPTHVPFRDDYTKKVEEDDFIVSGRTLEVKTKRRGTRSTFPPSIRYSVNMGRRGLEHDFYVFIEIDPRGSLNDDPAAVIVGWATPNLILQIGKQTEPGSHSGADNFAFERYDWDIEISKLYRPALLNAQLQG